MMMQALLMRQCRNLLEAKRIHGQLEEELGAKQLKRNVFLSNLLIQMYARCDAPGDAWAIFTSPGQQRNIFSWNLMLAGVVQSGDSDAVRWIFDRMPARGSVCCTLIMGSSISSSVEDAMELFLSMPHRDSVCWNALLNRLIQEGRPGLGIELFNRMPQQGILSCNAVLQSGLSDVFHGMPSRDEASWNIAIAANAQKGHLDAACRMLHRMPSWSAVSWNTVITGAARCGDVPRVTTLLEEMPFAAGEDTVCCNALVAAYSQRGDMDAARLWFDGCTCRNVVTWTQLAVAYLRAGLLEEGSRIIRVSMPQWSVVTWNALVAAYAQNGHMEAAQEAFADAPQRDMVTWNSLLSCCCGMFNLMPCWDIVSWNTLLAGTAAQRGGRMTELLDVFDRQAERDVVSWTILMTGAAAAGDRIKCVSSFEQMPSRSAVTWSSMVTVCGEAGWFDEALAAFEEHPQRDLVAWNGMLLACVQNGRMELGRMVFERMAQRDMASHTAGLSCLLNNNKTEDGQNKNRKKNENKESAGKIEFDSAFADCCSGRDSLWWITALKAGLGPDCFRRMPQHNLLACNIMLHWYCCSSCSSGGDDDKNTNLSAAAAFFFSEMPHRDACSWNVLMAGNLANGDAAAAVRVFMMLDLEAGQELMNEVSLSIVFDACCSSTLTRLGMLIHSEILHLQHGGITDPVAIALVGMYGSAGMMETALQIFEGSGSYSSSLKLWTAMLQAYGRNGHCAAACEMLERMCLEGVGAIDGVTILCILRSCVHAGWVSQGLRLFRNMEGDFSVAPLPHHYLCIVDLLGRAGRMNAAQDLIHNMPFVPSDDEWMALLAACSNQGDRQRGAAAAHRSLQLQDEERSAPYVLLFNTLIKP